MKCPHCQENLGLNDICINPACSYFGTIIKSSEKPNLNDNENNFGNEKNYNNKSNSYNSNLNNKYTNVTDYSIDSYDNNQIINKNTDKSFNVYDTTDNISRYEFATFIGSHNTDYYLDYVDKTESNNRFLSWNWPCFFLGSYWLLYRKLYAFASIFIILTFASSRLFSPKMHIFLTLIVHIVLTMFANAIYLNNSKRKIKLVKANIINFNATQYINRLQKKGGVNFVAPLIWVVIYVCVSIISMFLFFLFATTVNPTDFVSPSYHF